jgi:Fe2+ transport system protein B
VALAGNPNTGKTTVFNALTGLRQHTGNWPGKTVAVAEGVYVHEGVSYRVVDLPGTYSLLSTSPEEEAARDFICFGGADVTVVVTDATCLERNLNLVLQITEMTPKVVVCLNLVDEAERKHVFVDAKELSAELGVPVAPTVARTGQGIPELMDNVAAVASGHVVTRPLQVTYGREVEALVACIESSLREVVPKAAPWLSPRWVALRLIDGDPGLIRAIDAALDGQVPPDVNPRRVTRSVVAKGGIPA